ncbi:MAG: radical SAM/SPASM domain-containing protein [Methermicoccaceae archaeon]
MLVYESKLLKVRAEYDEGVRLKASGVLAPAVSPILSKINSVFAHEMPVAVSDEHMIFSTWIPPIPSPAFDRLLRAQVLSMLSRSIPDQLSISITTRCPNRCAHCGAAGMSPSAEPTLNEIERAISESLSMGTYLISFDGGEPMLRDDLEHMVEAVDSKKAIATTFTSGYGLTSQRAASLRRSGLYAVRVSFDFPTEEKHDAFRGRKGAFEDATKAIANALAAGLLVDMFVVISPHNIDLLDEFYSLACELGVHELSLYEIVAVGRWAQHTQEVLSDRDVKRLSEFHKQKNTAGEVRVSAFPYFMSPEMFGCFAGRRWAHITAGGEVLPCAYMPLSFGSIKEKELSQIWRHMRSFEAFKHPAQRCRMRDASFRARWVDGHTELPYRVDGA